MSDSKKKMNSGTLQSQFSAVLAEIQKNAFSGRCRRERKTSQFGLVCGWAC